MKWVKWFIGLSVFFAIFGDFVANEQPIAVRDQSGALYFPIIQNYVRSFKGQGPSIIRDWNTSEHTFLLMPLIPYSAKTLDLKNGNYIGPFDRQETKNLRFRHWLGTDKLGRDVLAGLIHGFRIAFLIGLLSMLFALLLGVPLGTLMGYLGNDRWHLNIIQIAILICSMVYFFFLNLTMYRLIKFDLLSFNGFILRIILFIGVVIAMMIGIGRLFPGFKKFSMPIDLFGMRFIEIFKSLPGLFMLLALLSLSVHPSIIFISFIIGFLRWPGIARYVRAEVWKVKEQDYIKAAKSLGVPEWKVVWSHLLPNALSPIIVAVAFGFASAILLESGLSFLGLGLSVEDISWGKLLAAGRSRIDAWWLIAFPGLAIFATIYSCNILGDHMTQKLNPSIRDSSL